MPIQFCSSRPTITNYEPLESRSSLASKSTDATTTNSSRVASKRPSWKYFANHNVLSSTSITTSSTSTNRSRFLPSTKTSVSNFKHCQKGNDLGQVVLCINILNTGQTNAPQQETPYCTRAKEQIRLHETSIRCQRSNRDI